MSVGDGAAGVLLVALCAHVGVLVVALVRGSLPQRRSSERALALSAGSAALVGELLALGSLLGRPAPLPWVAGLLALGLLLGVLARATWRAHPAGRAAFHAVVAAPLVAMFVLALTFR